MPIEPSTAKALQRVGRSISPDLPPSHSTKEQGTSRHRNRNNSNGRRERSSAEGHFRKRITSDRDRHAAVIRKGDEAVSGANHAIPKENDVKHSKPSKTYPITIAKNNDRTAVQGKATEEQLDSTYQTITWKRYRYKRKPGSRLNKDMPDKPEPAHQIPIVALANKSPLERKPRARKRRSQIPNPETDALKRKTSSDLIHSNRATWASSHLAISSRLQQLPYTLPKHRGGKPKGHAIALGPPESRLSIPLNHPASPTATQIQQPVQPPPVDGSRPQYPGDVDSERLVGRNGDATSGRSRFPWWNGLVGYLQFVPARLTQIVRRRSRPHVQGNASALDLSSGPFVKSIPSGGAASVSAPVLALPTGIGSFEPIRLSTSWQGVGAGTEMFSSLPRRKSWFKRTGSGSKFIEGF